MHPDGWRECRVAADPHGNFIWENHHPVDDPHLLAALAAIGIRFPTGYRTEVRTNFRSFLEPLTRCLSSGLLLWPDYGFARPEYYDPARKSGTLRTFSKHRAAENPLETPGEIDITAHVDFTAFAEAAHGARLPSREFPKPRRLAHRNRPRMVAQSRRKSRRSALRQFQTLTHPAHLGGSFHVIELSWNHATREPSPETAHRLAL